ncbi:MAG: Crp/Fnr family transcriptional regulator [Pseudonocardia sp.]
MDVAVRSAIGASHLRALEARSLAELQVGARRITEPAGAVLHREGEVAPQVDLVLSGLVRVFVTGPDGRRRTVRYARRGALLGLLALFAAGFRAPATTQAVVASDLLALRPSVVTAVTDNDARVANALLREQNDEAVSFIAEVAGTGRASMRQKVARHVLDLAADGQHSSELLAPIGHQALADALGSVPDVVMPILHELREQGVVKPAREGIAVTNPDGLAVIGWSAGS